MKVKISEDAASNGEKTLAYTGGNVEIVPKFDRSRVPIMDIVAWENGELNDEEVITLFQALIDSGLAWKLQGAYGRLAKRLIEEELCHV